MHRRRDDSYARGKSPDNLSEHVRGDTGLRCQWIGGDCLKTAGAIRHG